MPLLWHACIVRVAQAYAFGPFFILLSYLMIAHLLHNPPGQTQAGVCSSIGPVCITPTTRGFKCISMAIPWHTATHTHTQASFRTQPLPLNHTCIHFISTRVACCSGALHSCPRRDGTAGAYVWLPLSLYRCTGRIRPLASFQAIPLHNQACWPAYMLL